LELEAVKANKLYEEIADQLKQAILNGQFPPGSRLPSVRELSQQLSVGQATVREALSALKAMGLITIKQGEGTFVNRFDPNEIAKPLQSITLCTKEDIFGLLELRKIIETGTARLAAKRRNDQDLERMRAALSKMEKELSVAAAGEQADWEFHYAIAQASKNPFILTLMDTISDKIRTALKDIRLYLFRTPGAPERLWKEHVAVYQAILSQDSDQAGERMLLHLVQVEEYMKQ
jgi:GntR family transcriptional repressor for pyruvate dehydrogenase complex